jgi:hypothetical protein
MNCINSDTYDKDEMPNLDDAGSQADAREAQPVPAQAEAAPAPAETPQLLLTAGNTAETNPAPPKPAARASSGKASRAASRAREAANTEAPAPADEGKPGIVFNGKAVIDRFEGKWAVLLLGDDEKPVSVPKKSLPRRVQAGQWLNVQLAGQEGDEVVSAKVDPEETARMKKRIMDKLALLRSGAYLSEGTDEKPPQS